MRAIEQPKTRFFLSLIPRLFDIEFSPEAKEKVKESHSILQRNPTWNIVINGLEHTGDPDNYVMRHVLDRIDPDLKYDSVFYVGHYRLEHDLLFRFKASLGAWLVGTRILPVIQHYMELDPEKYGYNHKQIREQHRKSIDTLNRLTDLNRNRKVAFLLYEKGSRDPDKEYSKNAIKGLLRRTTPSLYTSIRTCWEDIADSGSRTGEPGKRHQRAHVNIEDMIQFTDRYQISLPNVD